MKKLSLIVLTTFISLAGYASGSLVGKCTPSLVGSGFSGTTTYCAGATATAITYNYAECSSGTGGPTGVACTATWYYNTTNTTVINGNTVTVSGPTAFTSAAGLNGNLPTVTPVTTTAGVYYYFCVVTWTTSGTCTSPFTTATLAVTINAMPTAISGANAVCVGSTITLSDAVAGGTWTSSNTSQMTVGPSSGVVTGVGGTASPTVTYILPTGCQIAKSVTVNVLPGAITGTASVCTGATSTLNDGTAGGTWSSSNTAVATIGTTHILNGVAAGTSTISYTLGTGCYTTVMATVNQTPGAVSGVSSGCVGTTTTISDAIAGGTWTSSNAAMATIGTGTGVVTFVAAGSPIMTYKLPGGCSVTHTVTTNALPAAITGTASACAGSTTTLADATAGGTWSSGNAAIATIGTAHVVTGIAAGTVKITYALATGCLNQTTVTINATPAAISGSNGVCPGLTITLSDATAAGKWTSSNSSALTIGSGTGIVTPILTSGNATMAYTMPNGCKTTLLISINPAPAAISGSTTTCLGYTSTVSDATAGGTWSSSNTGVATIGVSGIISGLSTGTSIITYVGTNGCYKTFTESIIAVPTSINGTKDICQGTSTNLTDATSGATSWTSSNTAVATAINSGTITGVSGGTTTITYKVSTGCFATTTMTITPTSAAITGTKILCSNASTTLADAATGAAWTSTWTSSNNMIANVGATTGVVNGVNGGTATITFSTGCGANTTTTITVNQAPAAITGASSICSGLTTTLSDIFTGGTWSSNATSVATINAATGVATAIAAGTSTISYTISTGCSSTTNININRTPATVSVSGGGAVCNSTMLNANNGSDGTIYYQGTTPNGTSTGTPSISQTESTSGTYYFRALSDAGCWSNQGSASVTVTDLSTVSNTLNNLCPGSTGVLSDITTGGTWTSNNTGIATINATTGEVTAITEGTSVITYSLGGACSTVTVITVSPNPTVSTGDISPAIKGVTGTTPLHFYTTGSPINYNIAWSSAAHTAGFSDITNGLMDTLTQDTVLYITIPSTAPAAIYTATLSVSSPGCSSRGAAINTIVNSPINITTFAGNGSSGYNGDNGAATASKISHPSSVASDCSGNTYIADYDNGVVRKVNAQGVITTFAGTGAIGYSGDGGQATLAKLSNPTGLAIDGAGNVYISDYENMVIRKVDTSGIITTFAGNGTHGYSGDGGAATSAELNYPVGLAVDNSNNVYIADYLNSVVRMVNSTTGIITTVAGNGTSGYSGDGNTAVDATLNNPRGIAVDAAGNIYIADYGNNAIRKVDVSGIISTIAGVGIAGYDGDGYSATLAELNNPWDVVLDGYGNIYFSELHNNIIRKVDTSGLISTFAGNNFLGEGFTNGDDAINAQLDQPMGIAINCSGNLYIADNANYAVRVIGTYNRAPFFVGGITQILTVYQGTPSAPLNSLLAVTDYDTAQTESWSIINNAVHGTVTVSYTTSSTGNAILPSGLSYVPAPGYTGTDSFTVQVTDGIATANTTIYVTVTGSEERSSGTNTTGVNNTAVNSESLQLFPNPTKGDFNIKTSNSGTFYLFTVTGQAIAEYSVTSGQTLINVPAGMSAGMYIGRFKDIDGNTTDLKFVFEQ